MKVALVHDYLTQRGGAERAFLSMCRAFPDAEIFTSLYEPELTFPEFGDFEIHTTPLNRVRALRRRHRLALPLLASTFSRLEIDADVTICSSSGWAHGVRTRGAKVVYCYNPARWLYQTEQYTGDRKSPGAAAVRLVGNALRRWDYRAAHSATRYLAISDTVRERIQETYGIHADIVEPPITIDPSAPQTAVEGIDDGYFVCVSRLLRYKNVEAIIAAFALLPNERLVIVGRGPLEEYLKSIALGNVTLIGTVNEAELRWLYAHSRALVAASYEDFGLTPVEALAFGKPSVVLRYGGFRETVLEWETGVFFDEPAGPAIARAVKELRQLPFAPDVLAKRAENYSQARFEERLHSSVASAAAGTKFKPRGAAGETTSD